MRGFCALQNFSPRSVLKFWFYTAELSVGYQSSIYTVGEGNVLQQVCLVTMNGATLQDSVSISVSTSNIGAVGKCTTID